MTGDTSAAGARIVDRGYQHYRGTRLGSGHAFWVMVRAAMRRAMGIRRSTRAKILPWLLVIASYLPTLLLLAIPIMTGGASRFPARGASGSSYSGAFANITLFFVLFAGLAAPDLLCADRRERVLSLYLASPITRLQYPLAQSLGLAFLLLSMTLGPGVLLLAGDTVLADSAGPYLRDHLGDLWHLVLSGGLLALFYGTVAMAVAAFTDRRAYASGAYLGLMLVSSIAGNVLVRDMSFSGHERFSLLDLPDLPVRASQWLFGQALPPEVSGWGYLGVSLTVIAASLALLAWRYLGTGD